MPHCVQASNKIHSPSLEWSSEIGQVETWTDSLHYLRMTAIPLHWLKLATVV